MSKTTARTDGEFGQYYADTVDIRAVIAAYRADTGFSYRQAWERWFFWALLGSLTTKRVSNHYSDVGV